MSVGHQRLNLTDRKDHLRLLPQHLGDIDGSKRYIVGKIHV